MPTEIILARGADPDRAGRHQMSIARARAPQGTDGHCQLPQMAVITRARPRRGQTLRGDSVPISCYSRPHAQGPDAAGHPRACLLEDRTTARRDRTLQLVLITLAAQPLAPARVEDRRGTAPPLYTRAGPNVAVRGSQGLT